MSEANPSLAASRLQTETLLIVATASIIASLDLFVVNLAFSSIRASFPGTTNQALSWVLSAYSILFAAALVPSGRLADRYGRRRVFRLGLVVFGIASAACALAPSVVVLVLARAAKGVGAAMMVPTSLGLLLAAYPRERHTQMVGIWSATGSVASSLGPVIGGALVNLDWRLIFLINVPLAAIATWRSKHLAETERVTKGTPDLVGSALLALGIAVLVAAISYLPEWGLTSSNFIATTIVACVLLGGFARRCVTHSAPALDFRMFRARPFLAATLGMLSFYVGFAIMLLGGTLFLTSVWGWDALHAGLGYALGPASAVLSALVAGKLNAAPKRLVLLGAGAFVVAGLWWRLVLGESHSWLFGYLPPLMLFGAGAGIAQTGFLSGGTAALPATDYATGSAVLHTSRQLGTAIGVAVFVASSGTASSASQYAPAWLVLVGFAMVGGVSAFALRGRDDPQRSPHADEFLGRAARGP